MHLSLVIPGRAKREPGISRFRVRCVASPRNDDASAFPTVIASATEAIHGAAGGGMDCFVAIAPRNDGRPSSRDTNASEFCHDRSSLHKSEGAGNAGGALHPRSHTQMEKGAHEHTGSAEAPGIPCAAALRLMPCSPRRRIRLVTVVGGFWRSFKPGWAWMITADLAPATGVRTTRFCRTLETSFVLRALPSLTRINSPCDRVYAPTLSRPPHPIPRS